MARIALIVLTVVFASGMAVLAEEPPPAGDPVERAATETPTPTATAIPSPTPTPTPPPTPTSAPDPTPTPKPTHVPTPGPTSTAEPTVETTVTPEPTANPATPTAEPTITPPPTPEPTPTPSPAPTPTPSPTPRTVSPQTVVEGDLCTLTGPDVVGRGGGLQKHARFDCVGSRTPVTLEVSAVPDQWEFRIAGDATGPNKTFSRNAYGPKPFARLAPYVIEFGPSTGAITGCADLTVTMTWADGTTKRSVLEVEAVKRPGESTGCLGAPNSPEPQVPTARVEGSLPPVAFSLEDQFATGNLRIHVDNPANTTGWLLYASSTDLTYGGLAPGQPDLPASSLRVVLPADGSRIPLSGELTLIVASGGEDAAYEYPLELVIPGGSLAGSYTATVTLTTAMAPGAGE